MEKYADISNSFRSYKLLNSFTIISLINENFENLHFLKGNWPSPEKINYIRITEKQFTDLKLLREMAKTMVLLNQINTQNTFEKAFIYKDLENLDVWIEIFSEDVWI